MRTDFAIVVLAFAAAGAAVAEEPPALVTDRPDRTESPLSVPTRLVQIESGFSDADGADAPSFATLVRVGLPRRFELRIGIDDWPLTDDNDSLDVSLGAKVELVSERAKRPAVALLGSLRKLTGDLPATAADGVRPALLVSMANTLTDRLSLGYNVGVEGVSRVRVSGMTQQPHEHLLMRALWTASLGISAHDRVGFFVEVFGDTALSDDQPPETALDGGMTWQPRPNLQLDVAGGFGLSDAAPDWFAGFGLTVRLPD